jgi:hypothetical protein
VLAQFKLTPTIAEAADITEFGGHADAKNQFMI